MTTEFIDVVVRERGAKETANAVAGIGSAAKNAVSPVNLLRNTLGALISLQGLSLLKQTVDTFANYQNRLRVVTSSTAELNEVTKRLFDISNRTRSSFQGTAEVFARFSLVAKDAGFNQEQLLQITENLNKATLISGANAREANNALIQLAQGFASGTLRGDELNSVFEQLPLVLQLIAKEMGVTTGEIRALASEGKITSNIVGNALLKATDDLNSKFAVLSITIEQATTVASNKILKLVGEFDQATGASAGFSQAILLLANNIDFLLIPAAVRLTQILGSAGLIRILAALVPAVNAVRNAFVVLGAVVLLGGSGAIIPALVSGVAILASTLVGPLAFALATITAAAIFAQQNFINFANSLGIDGKRAALALISLVDGVAAVIIGLAQGAKESILGIINFIQVELFKADDAIKKRFGRRSDPADFGLTSNIQAERAGRNVAENFSKGYDSSVKGFGLTDNFFKKQLDEQFPTKVDLGGGVVNLPNAPDKNALKKAQKEIEDVLKRQQSLLKDIKGDFFDYNTTVSDLNVLLREGKISQTEFNDTLTDLNLKLAATDKTIKGGLITGAIELQKEFSDLGSLASDTLTKGFKSAEDALVDLITTGKTDFKGLVTSILADIARLNIRQSVTGPLSGLLQKGVGSLLGGFLGGGPTASQFAATQAANVNTGLFGPGFATGGSFMVGGSGGTDSQQVSFRASPNERVTIQTPSQQKAGMSGGVNLNFSIDARGAEVGVEQRIRAGVEEARSSIVREAMSAVQEESRRSNNYLR